MYGNEAYKLVDITDQKRYNKIYEDVIGKTCYIAYFKEGERGWFLYDPDDPLDTFHRIHTTEIKKIDDKDGGGLDVHTQNAIYKFSPLNKASRIV